MGEKAESVRKAAAEASVPGGREQSSAHDDDPDEQRATKTRRLVSLVEPLQRFVTPTGRAFAIVNDTALPCDSRAFLGWCATEFYRRFDYTISEATIKAVMLAFTGNGLPVREIAIRVGRAPSRIVIDLGREMIAITADGIERADDGVAAFFRPSGSVLMSAPLVPQTESEAVNAIEDLRAALGVPAGHVWTCCVAWMLAALRAEAPYPILLVRGEQGSGKTTLARAVRSIVDPRRPDLVAMPREPRDLAILAEHAHVVGLDNVSAIDPEMSDALCRLATGDGFITRALYSDRDLAIFDAARPIVLTSIVDAATRPDLLDRALFVDLPERTDRADDADLQKSLDAVRPRALGALLYGVKRALFHVDDHTVSIPTAVRMRAPAAFAIRASQALGFDSRAIVSAYLQSAATARAIGGEDPVVDALLDWMQPGSDWEGTAGKLLATLTDKREGRRPRGWPESPRGLGSALRRLAPTLRHFGIHHEPPSARTGHDRERLHKLTRERA